MAFEADCGSSTVLVHPATIGGVFDRRFILPACASLPLHTAIIYRSRSTGWKAPRRPRYYPPIVVGHTRSAPRGEHSQAPRAGKIPPDPPFPLLPCSFSRGMNAGSQRRRRDRFIAWGVSPRN